jgi:hypothetical protein
MMSKRMLLIGLFILAPVILCAQTYINEHFGTFPPTGWTFDANAANWHTGLSNNAGGAAPEAVFDWSPQFSGTSRFISPYYNLTGVTSLKLQFRHFVDHYATPYTIGVATRDGHGAWHVAWSVSPSGNIGPQVLNRDITTVDVGADSFQICWYFTGSSYNIDYWYIDDILLYSPVAHDAKVTSINIDPQYAVGDPLFIEATVENIGLNAETFSVNAKVLLNQTVLYDNTQTGISLTPGASTNVEFPDFAIPTTNEIYDVIICTQLEGDLNTTNDTLITTFNTYDTPRDMVVLEIGTGTWCQYCPGAAMGADDLVENGHNVAVIEYHGGSTTEPFKNTDSEARIVYYGITGFPTAFFDGTLSFVGGSNTQSMYSNYLPLFNQRRVIKSAFSIDLAATHTGNNYQLQVTVIKHASIRYQNIVLHTALTESNINYNWQGQTRLDYVERLMSPNYNGTVLNFSSSDTQVVNLTFTRNTGWVFHNLEIAAFIQNLEDKEILQGTKSPLDSLTTGINDELAVLPTETRLMNNYPNPFNPSTKIAFTLKNAGAVRLDIYNMLGQKVRTLVDSRFDAGEHFAIWDGRDDSGSPSASGTYFVKMTTDNFTSTKKMVLLK